MTQVVFTLGYSGRTVEEVAMIIEEKGAILLDIRYSPASRRPEWSGKRLRERFGARYVHVKALGNVNYRNGGPIVLADVEAGLATIDASSRPVVLMCVCADHEHCHRTTVANLLRARGYTVEEISAARGTEPALGTAPTAAEAPEWVQAGLLEGGRPDGTA